MNNITEKQARKRVRQWQTIIDSLPVTLFLLDKDGKCIEVIAGEHVALYRPRIELVGHRVHEEFPKKIANTFFGAINKTIEQNKANTIEYELDILGKHIYFSGKISPMNYTVNGKHTVLFLAVNITRQKNKDIQLLHSMKMKAVGELTGGIAHNFNNLLSIIIGNLEYLKEKTQSSKEVLLHIDQAINASNRGSELIKQLLTFARHQHGKVMQVNINKIVGIMDTLVDHSIIPSIKIVHDLEMSLWHAEMDPGEFENVLLNLISNAQHAMPAGGVLTIKTRNITLNENDIKNKSRWLAGEYILLCIEDTGYGMPPAVKEKALEPFFTTRDIGKGVGMGLSVVYGFMRAMHGHIELESELGVGTAIKLYLPRASDKNKPAKQSVSSKISATVTKNNDTESSATVENKIKQENKKTILIVEDEAALLDLATEQIEDLGYNTYAAGNASQALQLLNEHSEINLMFTDVTMPGGMNGYELALKAKKIRPKLKLLLASGFTYDTMKQQGLALFETDILHKPYRYDDLSAKLKKILNN